MESTAAATSSASSTGSEDELISKRRRRKGADDARKASSAPALLRLLGSMPTLYSTSYPRVTRFARAHLYWFAPALLVDWAVLVGLNAIAIYIESRNPYERDVAHYLGDNDISWPHSWTERVPVILLDQLAFWLPAAIVALVSALRLSLHELHHSLLVLYSSRAVMRITVEWIKATVGRRWVGRRCWPGLMPLVASSQVGRLRPDFLDRCAYDVLEKTCTGSYELVKDGRRSFPSGELADLRLRSRRS